MSTSAPVIQRKVMRAERRFLWVVAIVQSLIIVAMVGAMLLLVHRIGDVEDRDAASNEAHRKRNELIHGCVNAKIDKLRLDIAALVKDPHGGFAGDDAIRCPPINP